MTASTGIITTIAGTGTISYSGDGGAATSASLNYPAGVALDTSGKIQYYCLLNKLFDKIILGYVYIADSNNNRIRKVVSTGIITSIAGIGTQGYSGDGGAATSAALDVPRGVVLDSSGRNQHPI